MSSAKNILYIGPYREESNRGFYAYMNIKALQKAGHNIKTIPRFCEKYLNNKIFNDIADLEKNNFDRYDICIQHCGNSEFVYHSDFERNIGICDISGFDPDPIINNNLFLLDQIVVNCKVKLKVLQNIVSSKLYDKFVYSPQLLDCANIEEYKTPETFEWMEKDRFYFYTELNFTEQYDWEKLIYTYVTTFTNSNTGLILKTNNLSKEKSQLVLEDIRNILTDSRLKANDNNMPILINNVLDKSDLAKIYSNVHCFVDVNKTNEASYSVLNLAAMNKHIISNDRLTTSSYLTNCLHVNSMICNSQAAYYNDITDNNIYNYYYTMDNNDLRQSMITAYYSRHKQIDDLHDDISQYDISNINNLL